MATEIVLLQPPPKDLSDTIAVRQWMENLYRYLFSTAVQTNSKPIIPDLTDELSSVEESVGMTLISSVDFSLSSSVNFSTSFSSSYSSYLMVISNVYASAGSTEPLLRFASGSVVYSASSSYAAVGSPTTTGLGLSAGFSLGTTANTGLSGRVWLLNTTSASDYKRCTGSAAFSTNASSVSAVQISGHYNIGTNSITGFVIVPSTAASLTGHINLYGVK